MPGAWICSLVIVLKLAFLTFNVFLTGFNNHLLPRFLIKTNSWSWIGWSEEKCRCCWCGVHSALRSSHTGCGCNCFELFTEWDKPEITGTTKKFQVFVYVSWSRNICFDNLIFVEKVSQESSESREVDNRPEVRRKSYVEMKRFKERWKKAVEDDICWVDPYWKPKRCI